MQSVSSALSRITLAMTAALSVAGCAAPRHDHAQHGGYEHHAEHHAKHHAEHYTKHHAKHHAKHHSKHHAQHHAAHRNHPRRDAHAVRKVLVTMVNAIDAKQWAEALAQFDATVFVDYQSLFAQPGAEVAAAELVGGWEQRLREVDTHHMLTNFAVEIDGDFAETHAHVYASHIADDIEYWDAYGRYHHRLRKTDDGWKITHMRFILHGQKGNRNFLQQATR